MIVNVSKLTVVTLTGTRVFTRGQTSVSWKDQVLEVAENGQPLLWASPPWTVEFTP